MRLAEATASFLDYIRQNEPSVQSQARTSTREKALSLLTGYYFPNTTPSNITPDRLRDFLARWYVDTACAQKSADSDQLPGPDDLLNALTEFFKWADKETPAEVSARCLPLLNELRRTLPRAFEISKSLSHWLRERGGAFSFPEYLTTFEEGGRSQYDIDDSDESDEVGVLDGYFRILRVEGSLVEAEELISGNQVWPIVFPAHIAALLDSAYIVNLEVVRMPEGWQITGCGFAYPPGTDV